MNEKTSHEQAIRYSLTLASPELLQKGFWAAWETYKQPCSCMFQPSKALFQTLPRGKETKTLRCQSQETEDGRGTTSAMPCIKQRGRCAPGLGILPGEGGGWAATWCHGAAAAVAPFPEDSLSPHAGHLELGSDTWFSGPRMTEMLSDLRPLFTSPGFSLATDPWWAASQLQFVV